MAAPHMQRSCAQADCSQAQLQHGCQARHIWQPKIWSGDDGCSDGLACGSLRLLYRTPCTAWSPVQATQQDIAALDWHLRQAQATSY